VLALLGQGGVVDDQRGAGAADQLVRLGREHRLQRLDRPRRGGDEVVQLLHRARRHPLRQRLDALARPGPEQAAQVQRRPAPAGLVAEGREERLQPGVERGLPVGLIVRRHDPSSRRSPAGRLPPQELAE
jgi:hypothetical protein